MSKVKKSSAERQAKTKFERAHWESARERSVNLLDAAQRAYDYFHGNYGNPSAVEDAFRHADAVRYSLNAALSGRLIRAEVKAIEDKKRKKG